MWDEIFSAIKIERILEVGSFEGATVCYLIDKLGPKNNLEIYCIDTWEGGFEHKEQGKNMSTVESNFDENTNFAISNSKHSIALKKYKKTSAVALSTLLSEGKENYFDFVYIDGSHVASDVLCDAILGFKMLKPNGVMIFDDYLWTPSIELNIPLNPLDIPKIAIDAFINIYIRELRIMTAPLYQLFIQKNRLQTLKGSLRNNKIHLI